MSSRSNGVIKERFSSSKILWVISSPMCSKRLISSRRAISSSRDLTLPSLTYKSPAFFEVVRRLLEIVKEFVVARQKESHNRTQAHQADNSSMVYTSTTFLVVAGLIFTA